MKQIFLQKAAVLALCLTVALIGLLFFGGTAPASAPIQNRRLPIYCVQTDSPKVALSFDAAWGDV